MSNLQELQISAKEAFEKSKQHSDFIKSSCEMGRVFFSHGRDERRTAFHPEPDSPSAPSATRARVQSRGGRSPATTISHRG